MLVSADQWFLRRCVPTADTIPPPTKNIADRNQNMQSTKITSFFFCRKTTLECDQQLAYVFVACTYIGHIDAKSFYDGLIGWREKKNS